MEVMFVWVENQDVQALTTSLCFFQLSSISKAINSTEIPVKEKHARRILNNKSQQNDLHTGLTW